MNAVVTIRDGQVRASSQDVAAAFDKEHRNVLRAIDQLIEMAPQISRLNFEQRDFIKRGRHYRAYEMDRDGFSLLAMGFTGPKALEWKLKFLEAFRRMEEALSQSLAPNDNSLAKLHPLLQTAEGRDALWRGREQVRLMKELKGREAALALWLELGLPLPRNFDAMMEHGAKKHLPPVGGLLPAGEMHAWIESAQVRANQGVTNSVEHLYYDYFNWCFANDLAAYDQDKFKKHLRIHFGGASEVKRSVFAIEIGAP
jgi:Rha family phage regulatory protein